MEQSEQRESFSNSNFMAQPEVKKQLEVLEKAIDIAQKKMDYEQSHDEETIKAIHIVERFLRKSGRVCYGGQAINAYLPDELKFYDDTYDLPDYDFFTPNLLADLRQLVGMLQKEGFTDIYEKPGIHEGTTKLYVNFVAIADLTEVSKSIYAMYSKGSENISGIQYLNPDILRMNMYLELSRPRGDISRWSKVFERLLLLNAARPITFCNQPYRKRFTKIDPEYRQKLLYYIIQEKRVLVGAEIGFIYRTYGLHKAPQMDWILRSGGPVVFYTPELEKDSEAIKSILGKQGVKIQKKKGYGDYIPDRVVIKKSNHIVAFLINEISCNSFNNFKLQYNNIIRIASLDTLIYTYLMLGLLTDDMKQLGGSLLCLAQRLIELENKIRLAPYSRFPLFTIQCTGHQKSFVSLLREKAKRKVHKKIAKGRLRNTKKITSHSLSKRTKNKTRKSKTRKSMSKKSTLYK